MEGGGTARDRLEAFTRWRTELQAELVELPNTLRLLREGVADFSTVGRRLAKSTEAIEQVSNLYTGGLTEATRRIEDASASLRTELGDLPGGERTAKVIEGAAEDFNRALAAIADLNPLWPKRRPR